MKKALLIVLLLIFVFPVNANKEKVVYKEIAVYPSIVPAVKVLEYSLQFGWYANGKHYIFNVTQIGFKEAEGFGRRALSNKNYDVFVIGASARQYFHGISKKWKENVRQFVANGGGYVGICGGANEASLGIENPKNLFDKVINEGVLGIANVYINDDQDEEWQYLYKSAGLEGGVPTNCSLTDHPIVAISPDNPRIIRYEGGPGMYFAGKKDELMGEIIPLAIYSEEICQKAPIHFWKKENGEWIPYKPVKTDLKGLYAGIATTYGKGRVVLWGPHPEERTFIGGHVEEFLGRNKYSLYRETYLYRWVNGSPTEWSYNWWLIRRSVAWACGIDENDLPPLSNVMIFLIKPSSWRPSIYIDGRRIISFPYNVLIGEMDFEIYTNGNEVSFYIDGKEVEAKYSPPNIWHVDFKGVGKHEIKVVAKDGNTEAYAKVTAYILNP